MHMYRRELIRMGGVVGVATICSLAGCFGGSQNEDRSVPDVSFESAYNGMGSSKGVIRITHAGGEAVEATKLLIRGDGFASIERADQTERGIWQGETSEVGMITEGHTLVLGVTADCEITLIYQAERAGIPIESFSGPSS